MEFHASQKEAEWTIYWKKNNLQFAHELPLKSEDIVAIQKWLNEKFQSRWHDSSRRIIRTLWHRYPFTCLLATSTIALDQEDVGFWTLFANLYSVNDNFVNEWKEEMDTALSRNSIYRSTDTHRRYYLTALIHSGVTSLYALKNIYDYFISQVIDQRRQLPSAIRQVINRQWQWTDQLKKPILLYIEQSMRNPDPLLRLKEFFTEKRTFSSFPPYMHKNLKAIQTIIQAERKKHSRRQFVFWNEILHRPQIKLPIIEREHAQNAYWKVGSRIVYCQREATAHTVRFHPKEIEIDYSPNEHTLTLIIDSEEEIYEFPSTMPYYFKQKSDSSHYDLMRGTYIEVGQEIVVVKPSSFSTNEAYRPVTHALWCDFEYKRFSIHGETEFYFQTESGLIRKQFVTTSKVTITVDTAPIFYSTTKHYRELPKLRFHDLDSFQDLLEWSITINKVVFTFEQFSDALIQKGDDLILDLKQLKIYRNILQAITLHLKDRRKGHSYSLNFMLLPRDFSYHSSQDHVSFSSRHLQKIRIANQIFSPKEETITIPDDFLQASIPLTFTIAGHALYTTDFNKAFFEYEILSKKGNSKIYTPEEVSELSVRITRIYPSQEILHAYLLIEHHSRKTEQIPIVLKRNRHTNVVSLNICHHVLTRFKSGSITLVINDQSEFICHFTEELHPLLHMDESFIVHLDHPLEYDIKFRVFHPYSLIQNKEVFTLPQGSTHLRLHPFSDSDVIINGIKDETDWFGNDDDIIAFPKLEVPLSKEKLTILLHSLDESTWRFFIYKLNDYGATYLQQLVDIQPLLLQQVLESPEITKSTVDFLDTKYVSWEQWVDTFSVYLWSLKYQQLFYAKTGTTRLFQDAFGHLKTFSQLNLSDRRTLRQQFKQFNPENLHPLDFNILDGCNAYLDDRFYHNPDEVFSYKLQIDDLLEKADKKIEKWKKEKKIPEQVQKLIEDREFPSSVNANQFPTLFYITLRTKLLAIGLSPHLKISAKQKINRMLRSLPALPIKDLSHDGYHLANAWEEET